MVWSNWRGAVVMVFAWVGLAWSQAPSPAPTPGKGERIMTVHENGKSLRCRVLVSWTMEDGAKAFQLKTIDAGEIITIVEDGPGITLQEPLLGGRIRSLPMRIYHWGTSQTAPPGVPTPPQAVAMPVAQKTEPTPAQPLGVNDSTPIYSRPIGKEVIIRWEPRNDQANESLVGKSKAPALMSASVTRAPANDEKIVTTIPKEPVRVETTEKRSIPNVLPIATPKPQPSYVQVGAAVLSDKSAPMESVQTANTATFIATLPMTVPTVNVPPSNTVSSTKIPSEGVPTGPLLGGGSRPPVAVAQTASVNPPSSIPTVTPPALPPANSLPPSNQVQAPVSPNGLTPLTTDSMTAVLCIPLSTLKQAPTTAETASNAKQADSTNTNTAKITKPSMLDKLQNWLHPKKDVTKPGDALANQNNSADKTKTAVSVAAAPNSATNPMRFSTIADPNAGASTSATPAPTANQNVVAASQTNLPTAPPQAVDQNQELPPITQSAPKKDWRLMWGQPRDAKTQIPGQSMVNQAPAKPDLKTIPPLPPASGTETKSADILLSPEKFDPSGKRLVPKGIQMSSYHGNPSALMTKAPSAEIAQTGAPGESPAAILPASTLTDHAYPPTPPSLPASGGSVPPGAQSVVAAGANVPGTPMSAPVLNNTVPEPIRPPTPPAGLMPVPPPATGYNNAFTPPPPPPSTQQQNPMTINAFSNMAPPANMPYPQLPTNAPSFPPTNYQPNPMAQGYPVAPGYPPNPSTMAAQGMPNPYYSGAEGAPQQLPAMSPQGHPVAQINYPQNYQGPQPPNPLHAQGQQQVQTTQYSPAPAPQTPVNPVLPASERHIVPGASQDPAQFMKALKESPYPAQREWASNTLSTFDWRAHPEIVQLLLQVAQQDPAATVRASCVYSLGRMNAASEPVMSILNTLRNDGDPRVRQEVEQALIRLGASK
jgi:HEAT repeats